ncbi:hypothetical protein HY990_06725 [Candidatus Micrarchaeota archaeon]|nr:hypothetical protein [Candidatus Micrarchaeota archaeon]
MTNELKDQIFKQGYAMVRVRVAGLRQMHRFELVIEKTANGDIPFLLSKLYVPNMELIKVAAETGFPVRCKDVVVFPSGKAPKDFIMKPKGETINVDAPVIEAEIE